MNNLKQQLCTLYRYYLLLTKTTAALSYHKVRGLYFLAVIFAATILLKGTFSRPAGVLQKHTYTSEWEFANC